MIILASHFIQLVLAHTKREQGDQVSETRPPLQFGENTCGGGANTDPSISVAAVHDGQESMGDSAYAQNCKEASDAHAG
jgi:hypothetical protein